MNQGTKNYLKAVLMMIGMILGVGMFGVPYVISKAGALAGLIYFVVLTLIMVYTHLIYGETLLRTNSKHRLAGLAKIYLGERWRWITIFISVFGFYAVLIAYIIIGGQFLHILLNPFLGGAMLLYQTIFFLILALIILAGLRRVAGLEMILSSILLLTMTFIIVVALSKLRLANFLYSNPHELFLPYGVILFSITGGAAVPEVMDLMSRNKKKIASMLVISSIASAALVAIFGFAVLGATGSATSNESISGLGAIFGNWFLPLGALFGLLAVSTSFVPLAMYAKEQFALDFNLGKFVSWGLACVVPFLIFLFGTRDFIRVIGFAGAVFSGFEGFLVVWIYLRSKRDGKRKPEFTVRASNVFIWLIGIIFLIGAAYEVLTVWK